MSHTYSGAQFERAFLPTRVSNWEIPDTSKLAKTSLQNRFGTVKPRTGKTSFIVGDNGHLDAKHKKAGVHAFTTTDDVQRPIYAESRPRWPKTNVSWPLAPRATMGYKGNPTNYLPSGTVTFKP